jgi:hypothetical protein
LAAMAWRREPLQHVEDLALGVDGAPQIDHAAGNLEINLVKMPYVDGPLLARRFGLILIRSLAFICPFCCVRT